MAHATVRKTTRAMMIFSLCNETTMMLCHSVIGPFNFFNHLAMNFDYLILSGPLIHVTVNEENEAN